MLQLIAHIAQSYFVTLRFPVLLRMVIAKRAGHHRLKNHILSAFCFDNQRVIRVILHKMEVTMEGTFELKLIDTTGFCILTGKIRNLWGHNK